MKTQKTSTKTVQKKTLKSESGRNTGVGDSSFSKGASQSAQKASSIKGKGLRAASGKAQGKKESQKSLSSSNMENTRTTRSLSKTKSGILASDKKSPFVKGLLDSNGETVCREVACEGLATSSSYCRLHYIKNWKKIKRKEVILREKKLNQYIEELVAKYPDKYIEAIRQDLANDKDFAKVIYDLDLDESVDDFDVEGADSADSLIDTIKRDFDDEGDAF